MPVRTYARYLAEPGKQDARKGAIKSCPHALSAAEKREVIEIANSPRYRDLPPCKIVALLADEGRYVASESSFYRFLASEGQMAHRHKSKHPTKKSPASLTATAANQVWTWDITFLKSVVAGRYYYLYMHVDIFSRKIVGWRVEDKECNEIAAELFSEMCLKEEVLPSSLKLHSDNGAAMKGSTMLSTLQYLGVVASFSRPSVSNDNAYSEALFKTLKYRPGYPEKPFQSMQAAREWVGSFVRWYNEEHLHSGIEFVTPGSRHRGKDKEILALRKAVYEAAKEKNPSRWSGDTRAWKWKEQVILNSRRIESVEKVG